MFSFDINFMCVSLLRMTLLQLYYYLEYFLHGNTDAHCQERGVRIPLSPNPTPHSHVIHFRKYEISHKIQGRSKHLEINCWALV